MTLVHVLLLPMSCLQQVTCLYYDPHTQQVRLQHACQAWHGQLQPVLMLTGCSKR